MSFRKNCCDLSYKRNLNQNI